MSHPAKTAWISLLLLVLVGGAWGKPPAARRHPAEPRQPAFLNKIGMRFVLVPAGQFQMGANAADRDQARQLVQSHPAAQPPDALEDEGPPHQVRIRRSFYMGRYEVTQAQWQAVMHQNPSADLTCGADCPVENISWYDAEKFCEALNRLDPAHRYWLPTEAQWEYATRGGDDGGLRPDADQLGWSAGNSGDAPIDALAVWRDHPDDYRSAITRNHDRIHPVGLKQPNAFGLYDTLGNVWEWVADRYDPDYYARSPSDDPHGPRLGPKRVLRGGAFDHNTLANAAVLRAKFDPNGRNPSFGVRLAASVELPSTGKRGATERACAQT